MIFFVLLLHEFMNLNILYVLTILFILIDILQISLFDQEELIQIASQVFAQSSLQVFLALWYDKIVQAHFISPDLVTVTCEETVVPCFMYCSASCTYWYSFGHCF